jgi:hypothetical protein
MPSVVVYIAIGFASCVAGGFLVAWLDTTYCSKLEGQRFQARCERDAALEETKRLNGLLSEITDSKEAV